MSTQPHPTNSNGPEPGAKAFVWGIWGLTASVAIAFVAHFGSNVPLWDDYSIVPQLAGQRPVTPSWLWEQCNEHRIPVPKLIMFSAERFAGNDVRAGMFLSLAALIGLAATLIALAAHLPGGLRAADAVFPILLLSLGQATNLLWNIQFFQALSILLGTAYLIPITMRPLWPGRFGLMAAGLGVALLPLCGGTGLMFVPGLELWLFGMSVAVARSNHPDRRRRLASLVAAMLPGLAIAILYFRGFRKGLHPPAPSGVLDALRTALQFLAGGIGQPASALWPWSVWLTLGLIFVSLICLVYSWIRHREERHRVFGLICFLISILTIAGAVGWGRGWAGETAGFQDRYITMAIPIWCWFAIVFRVCTPASIGRLLQNFLFTLACACIWPNTVAGVQHGQEKSAWIKSLVHDISAGMSGRSKVHSASASGSG
jgi:hypothetical protein